MLDRNKAWLSAGQWLEAGRHLKSHQAVRQTGQRGLCRATEHGKKANAGCNGQLQAAAGWQKVFTGRKALHKAVRVQPRQAIVTRPVAEHADRSGL